VGTLSSAALPAPVLSTTVLALSLAALRALLVAVPPRAPDVDDHRLDEG
jgi:hypothetical protein